MNNPSIFAIKNPLLNLLINCLFARSAPKILSIKGERTFLFSNFLITGLYISSANALLEIISFLTFPPEIFYQKIYKPLKHVHVDIYHNFLFLAILNALSLNTLSAAVLLFKSLKSP